MTTKYSKKLHRYFRITFFFLLFSGIIATTILLLSANNLLSSEGEKVIYSNELYTLKGSPTQVQKDLFKELTAVIEKTDRTDFELPEQVVRNFIADLYTWTNKMGPYDVGGKEYIFTDEVTNFTRNFRNGIYETMVVYQNQGLSTKELIEIETVTILASNYAGVYDYYGNTYDAFYIEAEWTYKTNEKIDTSLFPTWGAFTLIKNDERIEIVTYY